MWAMAGGYSKGVWNWRSSWASDEEHRLRVSAGRARSSAHVPRFDASPSLAASALHLRTARLTVYPLPFRHYSRITYNHG